jgi:hypothetical protein
MRYASKEKMKAGVLLLFVFLWQVSRLAKLRVDISMRPSFRLILNGKYVRPNKNAQLDCFKRRWAGT